MKERSTKPWGKQFIPERKSPGEMLQEYEKVVEGSDDMIAVIDREYRYLQANRALRDQRGLEREDIVGHTVPEVMGGEFFVRVIKNKLDECFQGNVVRYEMKAQYPKRGERDVLVSYFPIEGSHGVDRAVCVMQDITERKRAETESTRLAVIVNSSDDAIFSATREGLIDAWNESAERVYGYAAEEIRGKHISILIPEDRRGDMAANQEKLFRGEALVYYEFEHMRKNGSRLQVSETLSPIKDAAGVVIGVSAISRDITERKRAEKALRESERKYRQLHESMMDGFVRVNMAGRITETNDVFCRMLGYTPEELLKLTYQDLTPMRWHGSEAEIIEEEVLTRGYSEVYLKEYQRKGGAIIPVEIRNYLMLDESGNACGMWAIVRDITARKWAEQMQQEYEKVVEGSDEMIAVVDRDYCYLLANRAFLGHSGLERKDVIGSSVPEVLGKEFFEKLGKHKLDECFQGNVVRYEAKRQYPQIGERDILASYFPIEGYHGVDRAACVLQDITERKRAEEALRDSEERFRSLVENATVGIYRTTPQGRILMANPALVRMLGYKDFEALAACNLEEKGFGPGYTREAFRQQIERDGEIRGLESAWTTRNGSVVFVRESARVVRGESGNVLYYDGVVEDITDRKRAEDALLAERHLLHTLMDNLPDVIYFKDRESRFNRINIALAKQFGLSDPAQAVGKTDADFFTAEHAQPAYRDEQEIIRTGQPVVGKEEKEVWPDGHVSWVSTTKMPLRDANGNLTGTFGVSRDITQRKRAEAEHLRLVAAIEQSAEAVVITNPTGDIEYVNPAFTRITGYSREEVLGKNPKILKSDKQDPAFYQQLWSTILKGQTWHGELINRRKDGSDYTEQMNITPVRDALGEVTHFIATKQDVTEHKTMEEQLHVLAKVEAVGRLAGGVAHDFNNLLTIINGYSDLLLDKLGPEHEASAYLTEMKNAGERAATLTRQLLAFSRRQVLAPQVLDLNAVVSNLEKMLKRLIGEDIKLRTILDPSLGRVKADPGQIEQVIMNLVVNARDAMPSGGNLTIETSNVELDEAYTRSHVTVNPGPHVMLSVSDTGVGMTSDTKAHIFEPFFTTKEKGKGTGLGLATVYGIVKQSGGNIWAYSEPGQGTVFKVYLPTVSESPAATEPSKTETDFALAAETILVVEDEEGVRSLIGLALKSAGYEILETEDGESALAICAKHDGPIHLLLTDVVMPKMSGPTVAQKVAALRPGIKVLYMSGYTDDAVMHHGVLSHEMPFIQKPFSPITLRKKIREVLGGKREGGLRTEQAGA